MEKSSSYKELISRIAKAKKLRDEHKGALDQLQRDLKGNFGIKTVKEAKKLIVMMQDEITKFDEAIEKLEKDFNDKYSQHLSEDD